MANFAIYSGTLSAFSCMHH